MSPNRLLGTLFAPKTAATFNQLNGDKCAFTVTGRRALRPNFSVVFLGNAAQHSRTVRGFPGCLSAYHCWGWGLGNINEKHCLFLERFWQQPGRLPKRNISRLAAAMARPTQTRSPTPAPPQGNYVQPHVQTNPQPQAAFFQRAATSIRTLVNPARASRATKKSGQKSRLSTGVGFMTHHFNLRRVRRLNGGWLYFNSGNAAGAECSSYRHAIGRPTLYGANSAQTMRAAANATLQRGLFAFKFADAGSEINNFTGVARGSNTNFSGGLWFWKNATSFGQRKRSPRTNRIRRSNRNYVPRLYRCNNRL